MSGLAVLTRWAIFSSFLTIVSLAVSGIFQPADAADAAEIEFRVNRSLDQFRQEIQGSEALLKKAKAVLVLPKVYKAGFGLGGEYGEGALRVHGKTADYYNMIAASWGFQLGAQKKTVLLLFMTDDAFSKFRTSDGWKAGVDASVALIKVGAEGSLDTQNINNPVVGFVIGQKGLMYDLSLEGAKFSKIKK
ncbi:MAG: hypothetical protein KTR14_07195 [Vampirovibrio sp.]|nr:hypothetical protein [Vampirovibrio sp.]